MTNSVVSIVKPVVNQGLIDFLTTTLDRAKSGNIIGVILISQHADGYEYTRMGFSYENAIGLCARAQYILHQDWDKTK